MNYANIKIVRDYFKNENKEAYKIFHLASNHKD